MDPCVPAGGRREEAVERSATTWGGRTEAQSDIERIHTHDPTTLKMSNASTSNTKTTFCAAASVVAALAAVAALTMRTTDNQKGKAKQDPTATEIKRPGIVHGVAGLIGNTPLMRIESLSELTGCEMLVSRCMGRDVRRATCDVRCSM